MSKPKPMLDAKLIQYDESDRTIEVWGTTEKLRELDGLGDLVRRIAIRRGNYTLHVSGGIDFGEALHWIKKEWVDKRWVEGKPFSIEVSKKKFMLTEFLVSHSMAILLGVLLHDYLSYRGGEGGSDIISLLVVSCLAGILILFVVPSYYKYEDEDNS